MLKDYKESNCNFKFKYKILKLDDFIENLKLNNIYKAVDFVILKENKTIFIEIKSYDVFRREKLDENITKIIKKLSDSYFILKFLKSNQISEFNKGLGEKIVLVVLICPIQNLKITPDRLVSLTEILNKFKRKLGLLNIKVVIDTKENKFKLFKSIDVI